MRVLVIDDEPDVLMLCRMNLERAGHEVLEASNGQDGLEVAQRERPDLVVLDVMLPGFDGHEVCRRVQAHRPVPVLMLTARDDETDVLVGLGVGADDYLTKPFRMRELVARVAALLRRVDRAAELVRANPPTPMTVGAVRIDPGARRVWIDDGEVHLTPTEFDLLHTLAGVPGQVLSRERLLAEVWGWDGGAGATRTVDSHVKALRTKIGAERVRTVHGVGYALEVR
jgi:DNA-binding response OmpR family regulator